MLNNIKHKAKVSLVNLRAIRSSVQSGRKIIMYHGIDHIGNQSYNTRFIDVNSFEQQIIHYKKHFNIITLEEFFNPEKSSNNFDISITFDDGYKNNYELALPILEKHQVPATFFVTSINESEENILWTDLLDIGLYNYQGDFNFQGKSFKLDPIKKRYMDLFEYIKDNSDFSYEIQRELKDHLFSFIQDFRIDISKDPYWKLMSDTEILKASKSPLITIGCHGKWHNSLGRIDEKEAKKEIYSSKNYLENVIQKEVSSIGYPDGSYSRALIDYSESIGFKEQLAVNYLFPKDNHDSRIIDRYGIYPSGSAKFQEYLIRNSTLSH